MPSNTEHIDVALAAFERSSTMTVAQAAAKELQHELLFRSIGMALNINALMPSQVSSQRFTVKYARFTAANPTPAMLIEAEAHAAAFINSCGFGGDLAEGAVVWVISRVWAIKRDTCTVFTPGLLEQLQDIKTARDQQTELYKAVSRVAKNAAENTFAAGLKVNVTNVLKDAAALQLAHLTKPAEGAK